MLEEHASAWHSRLLEQCLNGRPYRVELFRPRVEGLFERIERWTNPTDTTDVLWRSISRDNVTTWYGKSAESRIVDPADPSRIFSWLICESYDDKGNLIVYGYKAENSQQVAAKLHEANRRDLSRSANRLPQAYPLRQPHTLSVRSCLDNIAAAAHCLAV